MYFFMYNIIKIYVTTFFNFKYFFLRIIQKKTVIAYKTLKELE